MHKVIIAGAAGVAAVLATVTPAAASPAASSPAGAGHRHAARVCSAAPAGSAACQAELLVDDAGKPLATTSTPAGYGPADLRSAYSLAGNSATTVAIVDAYDDPTAESDLSVYRAHYGLPACTTANGCFKKVNQNGGTRYPSRNSGWAQEISLDVDMVSAICPGCHVLLVEASSPSFGNLGTAVNYAASVPGVVAISNSYGGSDTSASSAYNHPGIAVTASSGDNGYGVESPASYNTVVAVGGTSLRRSTSTTRGWTETAWSGAGSGCSAYNATTIQNTAATQCRKKATADVSAVADPNTGVAVYDSTPNQGASGWLVFGGTSVASPIVASVYALSGNTAGYPASYTWAHSSGLNDVTSGSNGSCSPALWCTVGAGWDGPTGLGTPNGTSAF